MMTIGEQVRRWRRYWLSYLAPAWRTLECPRCAMKVTARSGIHMTRAIVNHNRDHHGGIPHITWR
jgi:hypothetical protein